MELGRKSDSAVEGVPSAVEGNREVTQQMPSEPGVPVSAKDHWFERLPWTIKLSGGLVSTLIFGAIGSLPPSIQRLGLIAGAFAVVLFVVSCWGHFRKEASAGGWPRRFVDLSGAAMVLIAAVAIVYSVQYKPPSQPTTVVRETPAVKALPEAVLPPVPALPPVCTDTTLSNCAQINYGTQTINNQNFSVTVRAHVPSHVNNYSPKGWAPGKTNLLLLAAAPGGSTITGLKSAGVPPGFNILIRETTGVSPITFPDKSPESRASNQFANQNNGTVSLPAGASAEATLVGNKWVFH